MLAWSPFPLVRVFGAFGLGVFMGLQRDFPINQLELIWIGLVGLFFGLTLKISRTGFRKLNSWVLLAALLVIFVAGLLRSQWEPHERDSRVDSADFYQARVIESEILDKYHRTVLQIQLVWSHGKAYAVNDKIQWLGSYQASQLFHGDIVFAKGTPRPIKAPANPNEFDYAAYLSKRNVFWQHWLKESDIIEIHPFKNFSITREAARLSAHLRQLIIKHLPAGTAQEISIAMLIGNRHEVSDELEAAFARSGTIHILAVSGLHLGILYWVILQALDSWRKSRVLKWPFLVLSLFVLWTYTFITGMAVSTIRACIMCSWLILGNTLDKPHSTLNSLAGAALMIIWFDPYQLYAVGFQLSFTALGGILYLQPMISAWWQPNNKVLGYFWDLAAVSLSAQVAVLPITIYYFHNFPTYFLLSNLLVIPLAFAILITGIFFFISSLVPQMAFLPAALLTKLTQLTGSVIRGIGYLPGGSIQGLMIDKLELFWCYGLLLSLVLFLSSRSRIPWMIFLCLSIGAMLLRGYEKFTISQRRLIAVYHIPGRIAMDFIEGANRHSAMDPILISDSSTVAYKLGGYRGSLHLADNSTIQPIESTGGCDSWMFNGKRVLLIKGPLVGRFKGNSKFKSHIVIISNNSVSSIKELTNWLKWDLLLLDGSNKPWTAKDLQEEAINEGYEVHNNWTQGAKIINLKEWQK